MRFFLKFTLAFSFLLFPLLVQAAPPDCATPVTFTVTNNPSDTCNCTTHDNCSLSDAIYFARGQSQDSIINIQSGTYNIASTLFYDSTSDATLTLQKDPSATEAVILDGGGLVQILKIVSHADLTIQGITFQNGASGDTNGGALSLEGHVFNVPADVFTFILKDCVFDHNTAVGANGGAMAIDVRSHDALTLKMTGNIFKNNSALSSGAIDAEMGKTSGPSTLYAVGNQFIGNTATLAAGAFYFDPFGTATFQDNLVQGNKAEGDFLGGGELDALDIVFTGNTILQNTTVSDVGGIFLNWNSGDALVEHNTFQENLSEGSFGGLLLNAYSEGKLTFNANEFIKNQDDSSSQRGGGAYIFFNTASGSADITNNIFSGNIAEEEAGVLGMQFDQGPYTANITNNTIVQNTTVNEKNLPISAGGGIAVRAFNYVDAVTLNLYNNIIYGNTTNTASSGQDFLLINFDNFYAVNLNVFNNDFNFDEFCLVSDEHGYNNGSATFVCGLENSFVTSSGTNINNQNPDFVSGTFYLSYSDPVSQLIGMGDVAAPGIPAEDFAGQSRVVDGAVDLGAYEGSAPLLSVNSNNLNFPSDGNIQTLILTDTGTHDLTVNDISFSDTTNFNFADSAYTSQSLRRVSTSGSVCPSLPFTLAPNVSCTVAILFTASDPNSIETDTATLTITSNDPVNAASTVTLTGTNNGGNLNGGGCVLGLGNSSSSMQIWIWMNLCLFLVCRIFPLRIGA